MTPLRRLLPVALALMALVPAAEARAQAAGFKAGLSLSTLHPEVAGRQALTRFTGGAFVRFPLGGSAIQPELMWVTKGATTTDHELRLDYVEIPLLIMVPLGGVEVVPFAYGGPAIAIEVDCTIVAASSSQPCAGSNDVEPVAELVPVGRRRTTDFGLIVGGGVHIPVGPGAVTLEGRFNFGMLDLNRSGEGDAVRNRSGAVLFSYAIFLGR